MDNNLNITGEFTVSIKDEVTGVERFKVTVKNNITSALYDYLVRSYGTLSRDYREAYFYHGLSSLAASNISISTSVENFGKHIQILDGIIGTADTNESILGPKLSIVDRTNTSPLFVEFKQRILSTESKYGSGQGFDRSFRTLCLSVSNTTPNVDHTEKGTENPVRETVYAYAVLDEDCLQKSNEIADITYRLQIPDAISNIFSDNLAYSIVRAKEIFTGTKQRSMCYVPVEDFDNIIAPEIIGFKFHQLLYNFKFDSERYNYNLGGLKINYLNTLFIESTDEEYGRIFASIQGGRIGDEGIAITSGNSTKESPIQSVFSHNENAFKPLQDVNTLASAHVKPILEGDWNLTIPEYLKIDISSGGNIGSSTYSLKKRKITGFSDTVNTGFVNNDENLPLFSKAVYLSNTNEYAVVKPYADFHGGVRYNSRFVKLNEVHIVSWDRTGITVTNLITGKHLTIESISGTDLTDIRNCAVEKLSETSYKLYIACADTGLWAVTFTNIVQDFSINSTQVDSTSCLSVDAGKKVYALFNQSGNLILRNQDNWNTNLNFNLDSSKLKENSPNSIYYIKVDKEITNNTEYVAICAASDTNSLGIFWWDSSSESVSDLIQVFSLAWTTTNGITAEQFWNTPYDLQKNDVAYKNVNPNNLVTDSRGNWYCFKSRYQLESGETDISNFNTFPEYNYGLEIPLVTDEDYILGVDHVYLYDNGIFHKVCDMTTGRGLSSNGYQNAQVPQNSQETPTGVHLTKGVIFYSNSICCSLANAISNEVGSVGEDKQLNQFGAILNPVVWDYYSWNGSTWEKTNPTFNTGTGVWTLPTITSKTTSTSSEPLTGINDNLSLKWEQLPSGNTPSEIGEWYSYVLCAGEMKSESNTRVLKHSWYLGNPMTEVLSNTNIPASGEIVVPKSLYGGSSPDDNFRCLEPEEAEYFEFNIQGYSVSANVILDYLTPPGPNEVLVNTATGKLIFNSADVNKSVSGSYLYVQSDYELPVPSIANLANSINTIQQPVLILDGTQGLTLDDTQVVSWEDSSPRQVLYSQDNVDNRPITKTKNGNPIVAFDESTNTQWLEAEDYGWLYKNGFSFFIAFNPERNNGGIISLNDSNNNKNFGISYSTVSSNSYLSIEYGSTGQFPTIDIPDNSWSLLAVTFDFNSLTYSLRFNGITIVEQKEISYDLFKSPSKIYIGKLVSGSNTNGFTGCLAYLSVYDNYLTIPEIETVENYINTLYAIY